MIRKGYFNKGAQNKGAQILDTSTSYLQGIVGMDKRQCNEKKHSTYIKKTLGWILFPFLYWKGFAQRYVVGYLKKFAPIAVQEMERSGIPASIEPGQGILESSYGDSSLAQIANNHFGIKCGKNLSGVVFHHYDDHRGKCFRKYYTPWHSFRYHSKFLKKPRYAKLFFLARDDYQNLG
ncbi:MAG: glucosaminidase domain-containing protein [Flavobacteriales bacterium]